MFLHKVQYIQLIPRGYFWLSQEDISSLKCLCTKHIPMKGAYKNDKLTHRLFDKKQKEAQSMLLHDGDWVTVLCIFAPRLMAMIRDFKNTVD